MNAISSAAIIRLGNKGEPGTSATQLRKFVFGSDPNRTLRRVLIWGVLTVTFFHNLLLPIQIIGSSMSPTYSDGSYNFINKVAYVRSNPRRGDVVACWGEGDLLLKRILAVPGETVAIHDGQIFINDRQLHDNFADVRVPWEITPIHLRANEYWVIGDNRSSSVFCKVAKDQILGKIIF